MHTWYHLRLDPNLDSLRGMPEFDSLYQRVRTDLAEQAMHVQSFKAGGELAYLHRRRSLPR